MSHNIIDDTQIDKPCLKRKKTVRECSFSLNVNTSSLCDSKTTDDKNKFPIVYDNKSVTLGEFCTSSLFTVAKERRELKHELLYSSSTYEIYGHGTALNQADLDNIYHIFIMFSDKNIDSAIEFTTYGFLKRKGSSLGEDNYNSLRASLRRIEEFKYVIRDKNTTRWIDVRFFKTLEGNERKNTFKLSLSDILGKRIVEKCKFIPLDERNKMKTMVGKWLLSYLNDHRPEFFPTLIETLRLRSGATMNLYDFIRCIKKEYQAFESIGYTLEILNRGKAAKLYVTFPKK
ncbi:MAG: replication initiator protein A [Oligoflexia bacterium]|nr:replication initiator protein A [Oligoflexia bacterium]